LPAVAHYDQSSTPVNSPTGSHRRARAAITALTLVTIAVVPISCGRSDAAIERDVRSRLIVDNVTTALMLTVTVERGTVHVSGVAHTRRQFERASDIAREVVGADKVVNEVRLDEHPLATAVYAAVQQDPLVARVPLDIEAFDRGIVVLRSTQTNEAQRARLLQIAGRVPGVVRVDAYMK
jgi:osmotically-inducible protein OsmY